MHKQTKQVNNWTELISFIESVNPYKKTIVLEGWINSAHKDRVKIKSLIFSTKPVELLTLTDEKILANGLDIIAKLTSK